MPSKKPELLVSCHVALLADVRAVIVPYENDCLIQRLHRLPHFDCVMRYIQPVNCKLPQCLRA